MGFRVFGYVSGFLNSLKGGYIGFGVSSVNS